MENHCWKRAVTLSHYRSLIGSHTLWVKLCNHWCAALMTESAWNQLEHILTLILDMATWLFDLVCSKICMFMLLYSKRIVPTGLISFLSKRNYLHISWRPEIRHRPRVVRRRQALWRWRLVDRSWRRTRSQSWWRLESKYWVCAVAVNGTTAAEYFIRYDRMQCFNF